MPSAAVSITAHKATADSVLVTISNPAGGPVAFFNRISLVDAQQHKRILPVFYSDNYISVLPGEKKTVSISGDAVSAHKDAKVAVYGNNVKEQLLTVSF